MVLVVEQNIFTQIRFMKIIKKSQENQTCVYEEEALLEQN
jgi:hypothetical protein